MKKRLVTLDIELYKNYFLAYFKDVDSGKRKSFEMYEGKPLDTLGLYNFLNNPRYTFVSFNGIKYDAVILAAAVEGYSIEEMKVISDAIIVGGKWYWEIYNDWGFKRLYFDHIDVMEVAIGKCSLKIYGARIHAPKLQDLPIEPDALLTREEMRIIKDYCENDLDTTNLLRLEVIKDLTVREEMTQKTGIDMRSKSDAQIAEALFKKQLNDIGVKATKSKLHPGAKVYYNVPEYFYDMTDNDDIIEFMDLLKKHPFVVSTNGKVTTFPYQLQGRQNLEEITAEHKTYVEKFKSRKGNENKKPMDFEEYASKKAKVIGIAGKPYKLGMGGLHSQEKKQIVKAEGGYHLAERDVASYYPNMILNQSLYPKHLTESFMGLYRKVVEHRLEAKKKKSDKSLTEEQRAHYKQVDATEKIVINGSFGKFGSPYSILYAPDLLLQTTISGQIGLLILIDELEKHDGINVVSANTDGIVVHCEIELHDKVDEICSWWEKSTNLILEETSYKALYSRDVNNYIAVKENGGVKLKGAYKEPGLSKNAMAYISAKAVVDYLSKGETIEDTIELCDDIRDFMCVKQVTGGGEWRGEKLGKAVRWYYATDGESIHYCKNGNKVGESDNAYPAMNLPSEFPENVDTQLYIERAYKMLDALGVKYERL